MISFQPNTIKAFAIRVIYNKFGQNCPRTVKGDVENVKSQRQTDEVEFAYRVAQLIWAFGSCELINVEWRTIYSNNEANHFKSRVKGNCR